jgi:hypothetical protein
VAQATGTGTVTLRWTAEGGDWMAVAMNPDGSAGLTVRADAGVLAPWLFQLAVELIVGGIMASALSAALIIVPSSASRGSAAAPSLTGHVRKRGHPLPPSLSGRT